MICPWNLVRVLTAGLRSTEFLFSKDIYWVETKIKQVVAPQYSTQISTLLSGNRLEIYIWMEDIGWLVCIFSKQQVPFILIKLSQCFSVIHQNTSVSGFTDKIDSFWHDIQKPAVVHFICINNIGDWQRTDVHNSSTNFMET